MAASNTDVQKSLAWAMGTPELPGVRRRVYYRDIQLIPTLYFLKTAKYQIVLREKWSWRII